MSGTQGGPSSSGCLPPWEPADLPEPLRFSAGNALRTIGPGAILLVGSIGMGEWIAGPLTVAHHGRGILWVATLAVVLQAILNLEAVRYTVATGEPITTGFMRLRPGPKVWGTLYVACAVAQLGLPAAAAGCGGVLLAMVMGETPGPNDAEHVRWMTLGVVLVSAGVLASGRRVERVLERVSWAMIALIFTFLLAVNLRFVSAADSLKTAAGFLRFGNLPDDVDFVLLAVFAALAGSGGVGNLAIASWYRDKGFGMGQRVGGIGGPLFGEQISLDPVGKRFPVNAENLRRWHTWWRYALVDQSVLWAGGCLVGMFLMVNLAAALFPPQLEVSGVAAGVFQAAEMRKVWHGFWWLGLLNGFWILSSTHLANVDVLMRMITDIVWAASPRMRRWPASRIYGLLLVSFTTLGLAATWIGSAKVLLLIMGAVACPIMALSAVQILIVNTVMLPPEIRPPWWRRIGLVAVSLFYGAIGVALVLQTLSQ